MENQLTVSEGATLQDGRVLLLVGIGQQPPGIVLCSPAQVASRKRLLQRIYRLLASQGAQVAPEQVCTIAMRSMPITESAALAQSFKQSLS